MQYKLLRVYILECMLVCTWHILDYVGHQGAEVRADVSERVRVFVILSLQQLPRQIYVL